MDDKDPKDLLLKYTSGTCNEEEKRLVDDWYASYNIDVADISFEEVEAARLEVLSLLPQPKKSVKKVLMPWLKPLTGVAAACTLIYGIHYFLKEEILPKAETKTEALVNDIKPGSNKATLTLPNGKTIDLADAKEGEIASEQNVKIIKKADGQLLYLFNPDPVLATGKMDSLPSKITGKISYAKDHPGLNVIMTPSGGQYNIVLPDGTQVWVNAGSTLKFPSTFEDMPERRVYLSGEAYFEVRQIQSVLNMKRRARKVPFIVQTNTQEITVLGTRFNINSYDEDGLIKTTLAQGLVKVSTPTENVTIKPGQAAYSSGTVIRVEKTDVAADLAWKNGEFNFDSDNLREVMKKIARWYDVKVVYTDPNLGSKPFSGIITKYANISEVLNLLQLTGAIKFKVHGKTVTVMK
ncbi:FecR family protein [Pedobacter hiemivivus]|uniref:FecR family protein n=1 Tax=Pedobacter hiemivivus TaxID=2530454 RepID=A0A4R0MMZ1_9SPHI|nr:FecR family protein [Pedobacter hiemivivus]TCC87857.1 FecR family protein [Pedobacter hiemivivus]